MKRLALLLLVTLFGIVLLGSAAVEAADSQAKEKEKAVKGQDVTVKARKIEERLSAELSSIGHPVVVITSEEIEEGGYQDIYEALDALAPGLYICAQNGPGGIATQTYLQGSREILWLLDGVRLNNRLWQDTYLDILSINMVERIEVLYGGEGLFYGTGAAAGVINIITKPVTKDTSAKVDLAYGTYAHRNIGAYVSDTIGNNGFMVFGSNDGWDGYQPFDSSVYERVGNPNQEKRDYNRTNIGAKYQREFNFLGRAVLKMHYQHNNNDEGYAYPVAHFEDDRSENIAFLKWDHDINKNFSYYTKVYFHDWLEKWTRRNVDGKYVWNAAEIKYQDWGVNLMSSYRFGGGHEILSGVDYQNYFASSQMGGVKTNNEQVWALFAQYRPFLPFATWLKPAVGARYNKSDGSDKTIWNVSARADFVHGLYARGVVGTSFILPLVSQLFGYGTTYEGNPDLKPQESTNLDLGMGIRQKWFFADVGYFYQEITDMISLVDTGGTRKKYENLDGKSKVTGYTLRAGVGPFWGFSLDASYTATDATAAGSDEQIDNIPEYYYKGHLKWRHNFNSYLLGADFTAQYVGDKENLNTQIGEYWLANASVFVKFGKEHRHMVTLRADNLFDEDYYSQVGRLSDTNGDLFIYGYEGVPFTMMLGYTFYL